MANPFEPYIVEDPWADSLDDVPSIHRDPFTLLLQTLGEILQDKSSRIVLLLGPPGVGKTHLLYRLRSQMSQRGLLVYVPPLMEPIRPYRYLLSRVGESLLRPIVGGLGDHTYLELLAGLSLGAERPYPLTLLEDLAHQGQAVPEEWLWQTLEDLEQVEVGLLPELVLAIINYRFLPRGQRSLVRRLIKGADLPREDLLSLGMAESLASDDRALAALRTISAMARRGLPLVVAFDQIENLVIYGDAQIRALADLLVQLRHQVRHLLIVVSCLDDVWKEQFRPRLMASLLDRLEERYVNLRYLALEDAEEMVRLRLGGRRERELFPREVLEEMLGQHRTSRALLKACALRYEELSDQLPPPQPRESSEEGALMEQLQLIEEREALSFDRETPMLGDVAVDLLMKQLERMGRFGKAHIQGIRRLGHPKLEGLAAQKTPGEELSLIFVETENGKSFAARMGYLNDLKKQQPQSRLMMICDGRQPIPLTWKKSLQTMESLQKEGMEVIFMDRSSWLRLVALQKLVSRAAAGDLLVNNQTLRADRAEAFAAGHPLACQVPLLQRFLSLASPREAGG